MRRLRQTQFIRIALGLLAAAALSLASPAQAELRYLGFNDDITVSPQRVAEGISLTSAAGGNMLRATLDWRILEPQRDVWNDGNWRFQRGLYKQMIAGGITPIYVIAYAPTWARAHSPIQDCFVCLVPPAENMNGEWREFATRVGRHFPKAVIEVWNEPNFKPFWPEPDPVRFAEMQAIAYDAIKGVSPKTKVISGGLTAILHPEDEGPGQGMSMTRFLRRAYAARPSLRGNTDGLAVHPYWAEHSAFGDSLLAKTIRFIRKARNRGGGTDTPLWITETGISTSGPGAFSPAEQAEAILSRLDYLEKQPDIRAALINRLWEPSGVSEESLDFGYGLVSSNPLGPKPSFCALVARAGNSHLGC